MNLGRTLAILTVAVWSMLSASGICREPSGELLRLPAPVDSDMPITGANNSGEPSDKSVTLLEQRIGGLEDELDRVRRLLEIQQQQSELLKDITDRTTAQIQAGGTKPEPFLEELEQLKVGMVRGAERDQEVQFEIDRLTEEIDAVSNDQSRFPATLRESFLASRFDQSPFVIYNTLQTGYTDFQDANGSVSSSAWLPHLYLVLRERFQIQVNPLITRTSIQVLSAQIDFFVSDHLTISAGRFYTPLGFYQERLHTSWVTKAPDVPLLFNQVYPFLLSFNGIQFRGARYLGDGPVKLEYCAIATNGISLDVENPDEFAYANFNPVRKTFDEVNHQKGFGGRLGLSFPTLGLIVGGSALANGAYDPTGLEDLTFLDIDASLHRGNWDIRFEYARVDQQTPFGPIDRQGFYLQTAYRNYQSINPFWGKLETVCRFGWVDFDGIDLAVTGLDYGGRQLIPIDRNRYTAGVNYYFYPSLILKLAYEFNDEREFVELDDDGFLAQLTLGF